MTSKIKKCYYHLNLPFAASVEDIERRQKVLIKIQRAKALKSGKSRRNKIEKIATCANQILGYIEQNGKPDEKEMYFNTSAKAILTEFIILAALTVVALIGYFSLI